MNNVHLADGLHSVYIPPEPADAAPATPRMASQKPPKRIHSSSHITIVMYEVTRPAMAMPWPSSPFFLILDIARWPQMAPGMLVRPHATRPTMPSTSEATAMPLVEFRG